MDYEIPVEICIKRAKTAQAQNLYLSYCGLERVPPSLCELTQLRHLDLRSNRLTSLSPGLSQLTNLKGLYLSQNELREIGAEITALKSLQVLKLDCNRLRDLPGEIGQLVNLRYLYLNDNHFYKLPEVVFQLKNLKGLYLGNNRLKEIPEGISGLTHLEILDLSGNQLTRLPGDIVLLPYLRKIFLGRNRLTRLPSSIEKWENLTQLEAGINQLENLPSGLARLNHLQKLVLPDNRLEGVPAFLYSLTRLQELDLSGNRLNELLPGIKELAGLEALNLENNRLTSLPGELFELKKLRILDVGNNRLSEMPREVVQLENLEYLFVERNPLEIPPPEIVNQGMEAIRRYYTDLERSGEELVYRGRVVIFGPPGSGKTTLLEKLRRPDYVLNRKESKTRGLSLKRWQYTFPAPASLEDLNYQVMTWEWAGSGQEKSLLQAGYYYLNLEATLNILVLDDRPGDIDIYSWLNILGSLKNGNAIIVVINRKSQGTHCVPIQALENQAGIKGIYEINLEDGKGMEELSRVVRVQVGELEHLGRQTIPQRWVQVWKALENEGGGYISRRDYLDICREQGIEDPVHALQISEYLHDIRVILHFQHNKILRDTVILDPVWLMRVVYELLVDSQVNARGGSFGVGDIMRLCQDSSYNERQEQIIQLMLEMEICFADIKQANQYIIPVLLPEKPREVGYFHGIDQRDLLHLAYLYRYLPPGFVSRLVTRFHSYIFQGMIWRNGMVLQMHETLVEMRVFVYRNRLSIRLSGLGRQESLAAVRREIKRLHGEFYALEYQELLPCMCGRCRELVRKGEDPHWFAYSLLDSYRQNGRHRIVCPLSLEDVDIHGIFLETLGPMPEKNECGDKFIVDPGRWQRGKERDKILIIYSERDKNWLMRLQRYLKVLENEGIEVEIWDEKHSQAGEGLAGEFHQGIEEAKVVIMLISVDFLVTGMIMQNHLPPLLEEADKDGGVIMPLLVKPSRFSRNKNLSQFTPVNDPLRSLEELEEGEQEKVLEELVERIGKVLGVSD